MTKKLKAFIDSAKPYTPDVKLWGIHIIPDGKFVGLFGAENGYDKMILVGEDQNQNYYLINKAVQVDVMSFLDCEGVRSIDIPNATGCIRVLFYQPVCITKLLSAIQPIDYELTELVDEAEDDDEPVGQA